MENIQQMLAAGGQNPAAAGLMSALGFANMTGQ